MMRHPHYPPPRKDSDAKNSRFAFFDAILIILVGLAFYYLLTH